VLSIFRQNRLVQEIIVAENIMSYPRYSASICYEFVLCMYLVYALRLRNTIAVYYFGSFCFQWWEFMKMVMSSISITLIYFLYLLKIYQVITCDCVSWSYLFIYNFISILKSEIFVLELLLPRDGSKTTCLRFWNKICMFFEYIIPICGKHTAS
jgi:hypothetical protein